MRRGLPDPVTVCGAPFPSFLASLLFLALADSTIACPCLNPIHWSSVLGGCRPPSRLLGHKGTTHSNAGARCGMPQPIGRGIGDNHTGLEDWGHMHLGKATTVLGRAAWPWGHSSWAGAQVTVVPPVRSLFVICGPFSFSPLAFGSKPANKCLN